MLFVDPVLTAKPVHYRSEQRQEQEVTDVGVRQQSQGDPEREFHGD